METKARRSSRASGPIAAPSELPKPIESAIEAESEIASSTHAFQPSEHFDETALAPETAPEPGLPASLPNVDTLTKEAGGSSDQFSHFGRDAFVALSRAWSRVWFPRNTRGWLANFSSSDEVKDRSRSLMGKRARLPNREQISASIWAGAICL